MLYLLSGCTIYQPKPLQTADLDLHMQPPSHETIALDAAKLRHPRLKPIKFDFSAPLTEDELAVIAVLINPNLKALRVREQVAEAQVFAAGLLPDPQLSIGLDFPSSGGPNLVPAYALGLNWPIAALFTRPAEKHIAEAQARQVHYDIAWQEWLISNQVRLLARRISYLKRQLLLAQQASEIAKRLFDITKKNVDAGDAKIDELALRNVAFLDAEDRSLSLARDVEKTRQDLNLALGLPPDEPIELAEIPSYPLQLNNAATLFASAKAQRLDLLALQAGYESQEASLYRATLAQYPGFSLGLTRARDTSNVHTHGISISLDIPLFNRNRGNIAMASATREQLHEEYVARLQQTRGDIATLVADIEHIDRERISLSMQLPELAREEAVLRNAAQTRDVTLTAYEAVRGTLLDKQLKLLGLEQLRAEQQIALQLSVGASLNPRDQP